MVAFNPQWNDKIYSIINYSSSSRFYICFMAQKKKLITCCYASYHMLQIYELQSSCSQYRIFTSFLPFGPHKSTLIICVVTSHVVWLQREIGFRSKRPKNNTLLRVYMPNSFGLILVHFWLFGQICTAVAGLILLAQISCLIEPVGCE